MISLARLIKQKLTFFFSVFLSVYITPYGNFLFSLAISVSNVAIIYFILHEFSASVDANEYYKLL